VRLRRNTFAAAIWSESEIVRCFAAAAGHLSEEDRSLRASRWQLRNCQCQHMATSHLGHLGCSTHQTAVVEAVAAVVHRWVDPLAAAPGGQPA
jgi:hypothetical protein